jgi:hypothetical protein
VVCNIPSEIAYQGKFEEVCKDMKLELESRLEFPIKLGDTSAAILTRSLA